MRWSGPVPYLLSSKRPIDRGRYGPPIWMGGSLVEGGRDASGQMYMRNRYYDPSTGRFTQEDPIGLAGGINLYGYANGDAVNFTDPYGLDPCGCLAVVLRVLNAPAVSAWGGAEATGAKLQVIGVAAAADYLTSSAAVANGVDLARSRLDDVPSPRGLRRPYIRKAVRAEVESRAARSPDGRFLDANTLEPIDGPYDMGHKAGHEFWRERQRAEREGLTQREFNDRMNNPDLYQIEDPSSNRSHRYEQPRSNGGS